MQATVGAKESQSPKQSSEDGSDQLTVLVHVLEVVLGVRRAKAHRLCYFLIDHDEDLDALLGLAKKNAVEAHFVVLGGDPSKEELGGEPPA
jgi:hypothetical protein